MFVPKRGRANQPFVRSVIGWRGRRGGGGYLAENSGKFQLYEAGHDTVEGGRLEDHTRLFGGATEELPNLFAISHVAENSWKVLLSKGKP